MPPKKPIKDCCSNYWKLLIKVTSLIMGDFYYHIDWENSKGEKEHDRIFLDFTEAN